MTTSWEQVNEVIADADVILKLIQLKRESGCTPKEAERWALEKWAELRKEAKGE